MTETIRESVDTRCAECGGVAFSLCFCPECGPDGTLYVPEALLDNPVAVAEIIHVLTGHLADWAHDVCDIAEGEVTIPTVTPARKRPECPECGKSSMSWELFTDGARGHKCPNCGAQFIGGFSPEELREHREGPRNIEPEHKFDIGACVLVGEYPEEGFITERKWSFTHEAPMWEYKVEFPASLTAPSGWEAWFPEVLLREAPHRPAPTPDTPHGAIDSLDGDFVFRLVDDGTLDTVFDVACVHCGEHMEHRFEMSLAAPFRDPKTGALRELAFITDILGPMVEEEGCPTCNETGGAI